MPFVFCRSSNTYHTAFPVEAIVTATASATLPRLKGFVLLELGRRTEFIESLQVQFLLP